MDARGLQRIFFRIIKKPWASSISSTSPTVSASPAPSTAQPTSKPGTACSTSTLPSWRNASATAAGSASGVSTRVTPKDEPAQAGLTNSGYRSPWSACRQHSGRGGACSTAQGGTSTPAARARRCAASLSIHRALASTPQPTQGCPPAQAAPARCRPRRFSMQHGKRRIQIQAARALHQQAVDRSVRRQRHRRTSFFPIRPPLRRPAGRGTRTTCPLPRDTHRHGFKARTLHGVQNGAGRLQRDRMLGGLSPEQHGDFYFSI